MFQSVLKSARSRPRWSTFVWAFATIVIVAVLVSLYGRYVAPTRVALVNYPGFQAAKLGKAEDVGWVSVERFSGDDYSDLDAFDVVLVFGRGLTLSEPALAAIRHVAASRMVYIDSPTNPAHAMNSVPSAHRKVVMDYLDNAGEQNYQNLLRYFRAEIQGRRMGVRQAAPPREIASDVFFHFGPEAIFNDLESYQAYYETAATYTPDGPKVALLTTVPGPFNANRDHIDALIERLEAQDYRVYPIASVSRRLELLRQIEPDIVMLMPHGRLHTGDAQEAIDWLKQHNVPLVAPLSVFEQYDQWLEDPQGFEGSLLSMNVVLPELDGAIAPFVINAQFDSETEAGIFKSIPGRLNRFVDLVNGYVDLKSAVNADKKVGIVYFRGPGKNALTAGNMEVAPSLYNSLLELRDQGYDLTGLPDTYEAFKADLDRQGLVMSPRAPGQIESFLTEASPAFISASQYMTWCRALAGALCQQVESLYGAAPGDYLVAEQGVAVARLQYGNVALLPQPLPGFGSNTFAMVHGTDKAPPHTYLAAYFWLHHVFGADALIHFGTHGSFEFTPSKQVALSDTDWSDALIGEVPHFYIYTMSNVGEAIIAKRRSYATIINHLTPPFSRANLEGGMADLHRELAAYAGAEGAVRQQSRLTINQLIQALDLGRDLSIDRETLEDFANWDSNTRLPLEEWLESAAAEKITQGLYTLGEPYKPAEAEQTMMLMFEDTLDSHIEQIAALNGGKLSESYAEAEQWITSAQKGATAPAIVSEAYPILSTQVVAWREANPTVSSMDIVRGFIALQQASAATSQTETASRVATAELQSMLVRVMADPAAKEFVVGLEDERAFSHVSKTLSPQARERAQALSLVIPAIATALEQLAKPDVENLVVQMQNTDVRKQVFSWLKAGDFEEQVRLAQSQRLAALLQEAATALETIELVMTDGEFKRQPWSEQKAIIDSNLSFIDVYLVSGESNAGLADVIEEQSGMSLPIFEQKIHDVTSRYESIYRLTAERFNTLSRELADIEILLEAIPQSAEYLAQGGDYEFTALANALAGGYVVPASGGDPILNPAALPTGRNMYSIDAESTPSKSAWIVGVAMAQELIESHRESTGTMLRKAAFTLWPSSFIHSQGATIAEILYLLGVEPQRDAFGRIQSLRLIPEAELGRPRVDVVVQSAGQLRDLAASRLALVEEAVKMAAVANDSGDNYVRDGVRSAEKYLLDQGQPPLAAKTLAFRRSFGGVNNSYGTGIMGLVEESDRWESQKEIARQYLQNMGAVYGEGETWGEFNQHLYAAALLNTDVIVQPRSSNTWGALSLDHVYEFMGGLSAAVTEVTGATPAAYFNDFRNSAKANLTNLEQTIWLEARTSLLNPSYITGLSSEGGASSAEVFAESFRNTFGWATMRPEAIDTALWDQLYDVYTTDSHQLGLEDFFRQQNPYALQEMTGVMLEASRKGFWQATPEQQKRVAQLHATLINDYQPGCGSFTCGNAPLRQLVESLLDDTVRTDYSEALDRAEQGSAVSDSIVLVEQTAQGQSTAAKTDDSPQTDRESARKNVSEPPSVELSSRLTIIPALVLCLLVAVLGWRRYRRG